MTTVQRFKIWKTIRLGTGPRNPADFLKATRDAEMEIAEWARDILGGSDFTVSEREVSLALANVSVCELGFKRGAFLSDINGRALEEFNLAPCPSEAGPQLRLQYPEQPSGEWLSMAMRPIAAPWGHLRIFHITHFNNMRLLYGNNGHPEIFYDATCRFVFAIREKAA